MNLHLKHTSRRIVSLAIVGLVLALTGLWVLLGSSGYQKTERLLAEEAKGTHEAAVVRGRDAREAIKKAEIEGTPGAWERAEDAVNALSDPKEKETLLGTVLVMRLEVYGRARDQLFERVIELAQYNENDPRIGETIERARPFQMKVLELLKNPDRFDREPPVNMSEEEEKTWHATLWYHVGHSNYSQLWFVPSENKTEINKLIQKSLRGYAQVFAYVPHDTRTEYAIEALYEVNKSKNGGGGQSEKGLKRPTLLPSQQYAPTSAPGTVDPGI